MGLFFNKFFAHLSGCRLRYFIILLIPVIFIYSIESQAKETAFFVPLRSDPGVSKQVKTKVQEMLSARFKFELDFKVIQKLPAARVTDPKIDKALKEADEALSSGRNLYLEVKLDRAEKELKKALKIYEEHLPHLKKISKYGEVIMSLAMILDAQGRLSEADKNFSRLAQIHPDYAPDEIQIAPNIVSQYRTIAKKEAARPRGLLSLASAPAFAEVFLNGKKIGDTPLSAVELPPGIHGLSVRKRGYGSHFERIELSPGKSKEMTINLPKPQGMAAYISLKKAIRKEASTKKLIKAATALGKSTKTDKVIFGRLRDYNDRYLLTLAMVTTDGKSPPISRAVFMDKDLLDGPFVMQSIVESLPEPKAFYFLPKGEIPAEVKLNFSASLLGKKKSANESATVTVMQDPVEIVKIEDESTPFYKTWWFWTTIGVVVAGAATTTTLLLMSGGDEGQPVDKKPEPVKEPDSVKLIVEFP